MNFAYKQGIADTVLSENAKPDQTISYLFLLPDKVSVATISVECLDISCSGISHLPHLPSCSLS